MAFTRAAATRRLRGYAKAAGSHALGEIGVVLLKAVRGMDPDRASDRAGAIMRHLGPWLPEHRTGRANLRAAFPEKSDGEIETILAGVWENLGRIAAEFAHLDRLWDFDPARPGPGRIELSPENVQRFLALRDDGKPALIFAAHLANWELPALAATAHGLETAILFRRPNIGQVDRLVKDMRSVNMGTLVSSGLDAPVRLGELLRQGHHVAMLVDQYTVRGVEVTFFGRRTNANPLIARLARHVDCPIHGVRIIRLPGHRFRAELTEEIPPVRDSTGEIDVAATMQVITSVVEGWVREHPEQWLWLHRRWR
jgi:KDO2-lipid IV(A) lauroyltransferase